MARFRSRIGLTDLAALNLQTLARPFQDRSFASAADYHQAVREWIDRDLAEAALGNVDGPLKAALDVLRDVRSILRTAVEFGGLTPRSHQDEFLGEFVPVYSFVCTGPPGGTAGPDARAAGSRRAHAGRAPDAVRPRR